MDPLDIALRSAGWVGLAAAALGTIALLVWLIGLVIILRGTKPEDRDAILRAYGECQPRLSRRRGTKS